jgi:hypothetical protein
MQSMVEEQKDQETAEIGAIVHDENAGVHAELRALRDEIRALRTAVETRR